MKSQDFIKSSNIASKKGKAFTTEHRTTQHGIMAFQPNTSNIKVTSIKKKRSYQDNAHRNIEEYKSEIASYMTSSSPIVSDDLKIEKMSSVET